MLRLDKTVFRKFTRHQDQEAEDRAHWETRTPEQRQEILDHLGQQARFLQRLAERGREEDKLGVNQSAGCNPA